MGEFKFGRLPTKFDTRTIAFAALVEPTVPAPPVYDCTGGITPFPGSSYLNREIGDCVIAGRANHTVCMEWAEQGVVVSISDEEVRNEYLHETGGEDTGLVVLDSLKKWRKTGWILANYRYWVHYIHAFAAIPYHDQNRVRQAIYLNNGCGAGIDLPHSALREFEKGLPWADTSESPDSSMGHYVYVHGYNATGPLCATWGRAHQQMTWEWCQRYWVEAWAMFDERGPHRNFLGIHWGDLEEILRSLGK